MAAQQDRNKKTAILGFGREGKSLLKFLKKSPKFKDSIFSVLDRKQGDGYLKNLRKFDLVFRSPGVPYNLPELKKARQAGVKFSSATKIFFENYKGKVIGITGTKGKGTVSTLIYQILKTSGKRVFLAGNIGRSVLEFVSPIKKYDFAILELSSFQLQDLERSPSLAVMLDVFPDHLDAHQNLKEYYDSKTNLVAYQGKGDRVFYFVDNALSRKSALRGAGKKTGVDYRKFKLFSQDDLKIRGVHNYRNAVMAAIVAKHLKTSKKAILMTVKKFRGLEHRLEFVRKIREVSIYNDSISTNPQTVVAAVESFPKEVKILIAGGRDKNLSYDYKPLGVALRKLKTEMRLVVLGGENKKRVQKMIKGSGVEVKLAKDLRQAVKIAYATAKNKKGVMIFSPGAKSFDSFKDYAHRGRKFKTIVKSLK